MTLSDGLKALAKGLAATLIFVAVAEGALRLTYGVRNAMVVYVPLPYAVGDDYGPIPPWLDRLLILKPDDALIWRSEPNVRRTYVDIFSPVWTEADRIALLRRFAPSLPAAFRVNPVWTIALNSEGYRSPEFRPDPDPSVERIACIGDSWTFGMNVNQADTYPSRLAALLRQTRTGGGYEVLNFGVLGYSSFQGLQLLKQRVLALHPAVVVIGFAMNDSEVDGYRDKDLVGGTGRPGGLKRVADLSKGSELYKLLEYFALRLRFRPKPLSDYLREDARSEGASGVVNYEELEPWTRVSPSDYRRNVSEMIRLARQQGARAVLLDNELWAESPYRPVLRSLASAENVPLVDSFQLIADARAAMERALARRFGLAPGDSPASARVSSPTSVGTASTSTEMASTTMPDAASPAGPPAGPPRTTVVFRVYAGGIAVPRDLSIVGTDPALGALVPNHVAMHDDGRDGDEKAGDGIWSLRLDLPAGSRVAYMYTNSGAEARWEGLDVPHVRQAEVPSVPPGTVIYRPIESFGRLYMQADNWHTDRTGYDLIARAVLEALK